MAPSGSITLVTGFRILAVTVSAKLRVTDVASRKSTKRLCGSRGRKRNLRPLSAKNPSRKKRGRWRQRSSDRGRVAVNPHPETRRMGTSAGVGVCQTDAPAESAATSRDGRAGGDYVVHEIQRQELYWADGANDGVLFHRKAGKTAHTARGGRFNGIGAADGTFDASARTSSAMARASARLAMRLPLLAGTGTSQHGPLMSAAI